MKKLCLSALVLAGVLASAGASAQCSWGANPNCQSSGASVAPDNWTYLNHPNQYSPPVYSYPGWNGAALAAQMGAAPRRFYHHRNVHRHTQQNTAQRRTQHHRS